MNNLSRCDEIGYDGVKRHNLTFGNYTVKTKSIATQQIPHIQQTSIVLEIFISLQFYYFKITHIFLYEFHISSSIIDSFDSIDCAICKIASNQFLKPSNY